MLIIQYAHPLHGKQTIKCADLLNKLDVLHVRNKHGVTYQTLEPNRILSITFLGGESNEKV